MRRIESPLGTLSPRKEPTAGAMSAPTVRPPESEFQVDDSFQSRMTGCTKNDGL
jgi:hypothetical protein